MSALSIGIGHKLQRALNEERHCALAEELPMQPRLARNQDSGPELSPTHASLRSKTAIMITGLNSLREGE